MSLPVIVEAVVGLIQLLGWNSITILHDAADDLGSMHNLLPIYLDQYAYLVQYDLRMSHLEEDIAKFLESRENDRKHSNVLVMCDLHCVQELVNQVNSHEKTKNEQGLFTFKYRWLIIQDEMSLILLEKDIQNITHLTAVSWQEDIRPGNVSQVVAKTRSFLQVMTRADFRCEDDFLNNSNEREFPIKLQSARWKPGGLRLFEPIGQFQGLKWNLTHPVFPNERYGFNGRHFIIVTQEYGPFMHLVPTGIGTQKEYRGMCREIVDWFAYKFNYTYTLIPPRDGHWGAQDENGTWNGIIKDLQDKVVDFQISPLTNTPGREAVMDFTVNFYSEYTGGLYKKPSTDSKINMFLKPFKSEVWILIFTSIPFISVVIYIITRHSPVLSKQSRKKEFGKFENSFWYTYGALFAQSGFCLPVLFSVRSIVSFWWLFCIIITATYSGNLIAFLTVEKYSAPFETLEELADSQEYRFGTLGGTVWIALFQLKNYAHIWKGIQKFQGHGVPVLSPNFSKHLEMIEQGGYTYLADVTSLELAMGQNCDLTMMKEKFAPIVYAVGTQNNSVYKDLFSGELMKMLADGLFHKWKVTYWPRVESCSVDTNPKTMTLRDTQGFFFAYIFLILIATLILFVEIIVHKCHTKRHSVDLVGYSRKPPSTLTPSLYDQNYHRRRRSSVVINQLLLAKNALINMANDMDSSKKRIRNTSEI